jgi:hypothetical protein
MRIIVILFFLLYSTISHAGPLYCKGKIENTYIEKNGNVHIRGTWRNHWTKICNTNDPDTVTCSLWASYVVSAVKGNLDVTVNYQVSDGSTCATIQTYNNSPKPNYIMLHNPNA